jgi:hypothetical protein
VGVGEFTIVVACEVALSEITDFVVVSLKSGLTVIVCAIELVRSEFVVIKLDPVVCAVKLTF